MIPRDALLGWHPTTSGAGAHRAWRERRSRALGAIAYRARLARTEEDEGAVATLEEREAVHAARMAAAACIAHFGARLVAVRCAIGCASTRAATRQVYQRTVPTLRVRGRVHTAVVCGRAALGRRAASRQRDDEREQRGLEPHGASIVDPPVGLGVRLDARGDDVCRSVCVAVTELRVTKRACGAPWSERTPSARSTLNGSSRSAERFIEVG